MSLLAIQDGSHIAILRLISMVCVTVYIHLQLIYCVVTGVSVSVHLVVGYVEVGCQLHMHLGQ